MNVYINFNGNCREAVEFYAEVFKTDKPQIMTFGDASSNPEFTIPEESKKLIMHTQLNMNGSTVMFSDVFPGMPFLAGNNISLSIVSKNKDEVIALFDKLKDGGSIGMELQETFWCKYYGSLTDKFGISWQISFENEEDN